MCHYFIQRSKYSLLNAFSITIRFSPDIQHLDAKICCCVYLSWKVSSCLTLLPVISKQFVCVSALTEQQTCNVGKQKAVNNFWYVIELAPTALNLQCLVQEMEGHASSGDAKVWDPSICTWLYSPFWAMGFLEMSLHSSQSYPRHLLRFLDISLWPGWSCLSRAQPPTWRTGVSFVFWVITFELSCMRDPTSSYATADVALRI